MKPVANKKAQLLKACSFFLKKYNYQNFAHHPWANKGYITVGKIIYRDTELAL